MRVLRRHGLTWGPSLDGHHSRLLNARGRCRYRNCRAIVARIAATRLEIPTDGGRLAPWPFSYNEASAGHVRFRVRSKKVTLPQLVSARQRSFQVSVGPSTDEVRSQSPQLFLDPQQTSRTRSLTFMN